MTEIGYRVTPSQGNFLMLTLKDAQAVDSLYGYLLKNGLMVRKLKDYGLHNHLRITIGADSDNALFAELMDGYEPGQPG